MRGQCVRSAFSVVEMVIVIAIVLVLAGLLVPAIHRVRESAARTQCRNNMRQISTAALAYESRHGVLPPGYLGNMAPALTPEHRDFWKAQWVSSLAFLLSDLERADVHQQLQVNWNRHELGENWELNPVNLAAAETKITTFVCPWDDPYSNTKLTIGSLGIYGRGDEYGVTSRTFSPSSAGKNFGRTNYVGIGGWLGRTERSSFNELEGVFFNRSNISIATVTQHDGASNTLLFGETIPGMNNPREYAFAWIGVGCLPSFAGVPANNPLPYGFGSQHVSLISFAFCDGSVRSIKKGSDSQLFVNLSSYRDGNITSLSD